jgi:hypothetical protein
MKYIIHFVTYLLSWSALFGKNDTVFISNMNKAIEFDSFFSTVFCTNAKDHIPTIKEADEDNYRSICGEIKSMIYNNRDCVVNAIIPILKQHGSLRHILNYKKMYHIYFREIKSSVTWANSVYYIIDADGYFVYVELKDVFPGKHLVFDQALLKSVPININMLPKRSVK